MPDDLLAFRILPDEQAEDVAAERKRLQALQGTFGWHAFDASDEEGARPSMLVRVREGLTESLVQHLVDVWFQARSTEIVLDEIGERFGGVDPLRPASREALGAIKERLEEVKRHLAYLNIEVELPDPDEESLEILRGLVRKFEPSF